MYRLKDHEDYFSEIVSKCNTALEVSFCLLLNEKSDFKNRAEFIRYLQKRGFQCHRTAGCKALSRLITKGIILENHTNSKCLRKKTPLIGIYGIFKNNSVYVGLSKDLNTRWLQHRRSIKENIHRYFACNEEELEFKILHQCEEKSLSKYEILMAQKLKTEGYSILNESNFDLI
tara:strand:+ start:457 stop:978 length:522 start_codon:yes stop_codon:yes gene_type:complete